MRSTLASKVDTTTLLPLLLAGSAFLVAIATALPVAGAATHLRSLPAEVRSWPTTDIVLKDFDPPWPDWLPGHRGLDLRAVDGGGVLTPVSGVVAWVGHVGGIAVVVIRHGVARATYQPVSSSLSVGTHVSSGQLIGTLTHGEHCPMECLHWGLKIDGRYLDPRALQEQLHPVLTSQQSDSGHAPMRALDRVLSAARRQPSNEFGTPGSH